MGLEDELYEVLERRRRELGLTQAAVGERAFGRSGDTSGIQNVRRGKRGPTVKNLAALCEALDLEFYIGPRREVRPADPTKPMAGAVRIGEDDFDTIDVVDADASAGDGRVNYRPDETVGKIAFTRRWLLANGVAADLAKLVRVRGDSMAPTIPDDAFALVLVNQRELDRAGVFAAVRDGLLHVKRLVPVPPKRRIGWAGTVIVSDNPAYPPVTLMGQDQNSLRIIGRVRACFTALP